MPPERLRRVRHAGELRATCRRTDMPQLLSTSRGSSRARSRPFRFPAILAGVGLLVAACGTNAGSSAPGASAGAPGASASQAAGSQAPAVSPAASVGGTLTVWAMGNEGVKLKDLAATFMKDNPGTTVNVTPVDWGQAVAKLTTAIAGHQVPDVSQMAVSYTHLRAHETVLDLVCRL